MKTLLIINSSPRQNSVSRRLTRHYAEAWKADNPDGRVIERDLVADPPPFVTHAWIEAVYTPADRLTPEQTKLLAVSDTFIQDLFDADQIVLGVPMHNFSIPASLKAWIDLVTRAGKTFSYTSSGPQGLIPAGKKVVAIVSQGGSYAAGSPADFQVPYLRHMLGFLGLTDVTVVHADRQAMGSDAAEQSVAHAIEQLSTATARHAAA
jgi:FMN-dependent NADH-azoreductase